MNASRRWANEFINQLECVRCRSKSDLMLFGYDRKPIDVDSLTVEQLQERVPRMDVWCPYCEPRIGAKVQGPGRQAHKKDAATIANLKVMSNKDTVFDHYKISNRDVKRDDLVRAVKNRPCAICHNKFPYPVLDFHHVEGDTKLSNVSTMAGYSGWSLLDIQTEIEKCVIVCANCHRLLETGYVELDEAPIKLDEEFWNNFDTLLAEQRANLPKKEYVAPRGRPVSAKL